MADTVHVNRNRCLQVGRELIQGPRALFPPTPDGLSDWLEPQLRITLRWPNYERIESVIIYVDDTMNKEEDFLPPLLRYAIWRRPDDLAGRHAWPSVSVRLGLIKNHAAVDACLQQLQQHVPHITFTPIGLSLKRDVADITGVPTLPEYTVFITNGVQGLEYSSCSIEHDLFSKQINESFHALVTEL